MFKGTVAECKGFYPHKCCANVFLDDAFQVLTWKIRFYEEMATTTAYDIFLITSHLNQTVICRMHKKHRRMSLEDLFQQKSRNFFSSHKKTQLTLASRSDVVECCCIPSAQHHVHMQSQSLADVLYMQQSLFSSHNFATLFVPSVLAGNQTHCIRLRE